MDQEQLSRLIESAVSDVLNDNQEFIAQELSRNTDPTKGFSSTVSTIAVNAVKVAMQLSVQMTLTLLIENGSLKVSENALRPQLALIRGGAGKPQEPPEPNPE